MARSRENLIAGLDARKIGYDEKMSYQEVLALLTKAEDEDKAKAEAEIKGKADAEAAAGAKPEQEKKHEEPLDIDYTGIMAGMSTVHDFHRRITILERKLGI